MRIKIVGLPPYPGQWIEVDQSDYIVEKVEPDPDPMAPRKMMTMGGGPYGEDIAQPTQYLVTARPITQDEDDERRRAYDETQTTPTVSPLRRILGWGFRGS